MKRLLIVNADDFNLTRGVNRAILDCHDHGILTSTTFMANLPIETQTVKELLRRKSLGVGIHLNVTYGQPLSPQKKIASLLSPAGAFKKLGEQMGCLPKAAELALEYQNQINHFRRIFGRMPTHLDTHHQVHDHPFFLKVLIQTAQSNRLPFRRSAVLRTLSKTAGLRTTDYFFGNLTVEGYWRSQPLETILRNLPEGISEIMCHPGIHDRDLELVSSFTFGRAAETRLFRSAALRRLTASLGITLTHFGHVL